MMVMTVMIVLLLMIVSEVLCYLHSDGCKHFFYLEKLKYINLEKEIETDIISI